MLVLSYQWNPASIVPGTRNRGSADCLRLGFARIEAYHRYLPRFRSFEQRENGTAVQCVDADCRGILRQRRGQEVDLPARPGLVPGSFECDDDAVIA
jgi:hypothetical protein